MLELLIAAFIETFNPLSMLYICIGVTVGITVGAIPGLSGSMAIALSLPLTFYMDSVHALMLLVAMYVGAVSGGLISATLLRMPGTPASIMTTFDGYTMAQDGRPGRALGFGIIASFIGGIISWIFLVLLSPPLASFALKFGPFEYFSLVMMAIVLIASISEGTLVKGILSGLLGMLTAMPGLDPVTAQLRLTFGWDEMSGGLSLLPVLIGVFAVSQIFVDIKEIEKKFELVPLRFSKLFMSIRDLKRQGINLIRSSCVGTWIGILPGVGANIGSILAYTFAKKTSKAPEKFGTGIEEGIVASEAANNATVNGALIPLLTLGIPGSIVDAILLGALVIHNIQPGPLLFQTNPEMVYGIMSSAFIANIIMFIMMLGGVYVFVKLMVVPRIYLLPVILAFCVIGSFALNNRMFDVWVMLGFGVVGYILEKNDVPLGPFVIGFVLAPLAETNLREGLMQSGGSYLPLLSRPLSFLFLVVSVLMLISPVVKHLWHTRQNAAKHSI